MMIDGGEAGAFGPHGEVLIAEGQKEMVRGKG